MARLAGLDEGDEQEEGGVKDAHDVVVQALVVGRGDPPFKGEDEEDDFDEVEGCIYIALVGGWATVGGDGGAGDEG